MPQDAAAKVKAQKKKSEFATWREETHQGLREDFFSGKDLEFQEKGRDLFEFQVAHIFLWQLFKTKAMRFLADDADDASSDCNAYYEAKKQSCEEQLEKQRALFYKEKEIGYWDSKRGETEHECEQLIQEAEDGLQEAARVVYQKFANNFEQFIQLYPCELLGAVSIYRLCLCSAVACSYFLEREWATKKLYDANLLDKVYERAPRIFKDAVQNTQTANVSALIEMRNTIKHIPLRRYLSSLFTFSINPFGKLPLGVQIYLRDVRDKLIAGKRSLAGFSEDSKGREGQNFSDVYAITWPELALIQRHSDYRDGLINVSRGTILTEIELRKISNDLSAEYASQATLAVRKSVSADVTVPASLVAPKPEVASACMSALEAVADEDSARFTSVVIDSPKLPVIVSRYASVPAYLIARAPGVACKDVFASSSATFAGKQGQFKSSNNQGLGQSELPVGQPAATKHQTTDEQIQSLVVAPQ